MYDFQPYQSIRSFCDGVYTRKANTAEAEENQRNVPNNMVKFNKKSTRRSKKGKDKKRGTYESAYIFYEDP